MELALPVEPERPVKPRQRLGMTLQQHVVQRVEAGDPAVAAALRGAQAQQRDVFGRGRIVGIVGMKFQLDIGLVGPHPRAGQGLSAAVAYIVDQLAVEALRDRPRHHRGQQPIEPDRRLDADLVERQPIDDRKAHAAPQDPAHFGHRGAAGRHLEIVRAAHDRRQREFPQFVGDPPDLVEARPAQRDQVVVRVQIVAPPSARAGDPGADDRGVHCH